MAPEMPRPAFSRGESIFRPLHAPALAGIDRNWAWGGATGRGVRVAVIDSGIEASHPWLEGCIDVDGGVTFGAGPDGEPHGVEGPHDDLYGHGTACAAIIHQLAPEATITSIRVLDASLGSTADGFLRALEWAVRKRFDVINLSLGTTRKDVALRFYRLMDVAYFLGCSVVGAANNLGLEAFPSLFASITSCACNLSDDPFVYQYNPQPPVEFLARGVGVELAWKGGATNVATGNSFAAPHIAGITALIRSKHVGLGPAQVKAVLWACASNVVANTLERPLELSRAASGVITLPRGSAVHERSRVVSVPIELRQVPDQR